MQIIDSLTQQIIETGEDILIMVMINARSENNSVGLVTRQEEQYLLASLPIRARWSEYGFEVEDDNQFAVASFLKSIGKEDQSFSEVLEALWANGSKIVEQAPWNCSNMTEYSIFAVKYGTLDKLANTTAVRENVPFDFEDEHAELAAQFIAPYLEVVAAMENIHDLEGEERRALFDTMEKYHRVIKLRHDQGYQDDYAGFKMPYAVSALRSRDDSLFSHKLLKALSLMEFGAGVGAFDVAGYVDFYKSVHFACAIKHAMSHLDLPFAPTYCAQSKFREQSKIEFLSKVLIEELLGYCEEIGAYNTDPVADIDKLAAPLKGAVADLAKVRRDLEFRQKQR
jgi:hypothetical protein